MPIPNRYELKFAKIDSTSDGDNVVISNSNAAKAIVVIGYVLNASGTGGVFQWEDEAATVYGKYDLADNGGVSFAGSFDCPAFEIVKNSDLELQCPTGTDGFGHITYVLA